MRHVPYGVRGLNKLRLGGIVESTRDQRDCPGGAYWSGSIRRKEMNSDGRLRPVCSDGPVCRNSSLVLKLKSDRFAGVINNAC
jgi:hypothetical protein